MKCIIYFDGGATPNPGVGECAYVLIGNNKTYNTFALGDNVSNNEAEWMGLIHGLKAAIQLGIKHIWISGDSQLVINQISDKWKVKAENLKPLYDYTKDLLKSFNTVEYSWVKRQHNYAGILLEHGEQTMKSKVERDFK